MLFKKRSLLSLLLLVTICLFCISSDISDNVFIDKNKKVTIEDYIIHRDKAIEFSNREKYLDAYKEYMRASSAAQEINRPDLQAWSINNATMVLIKLDNACNKNNVRKDEQIEVKVLFVITILVAIVTASLI